MEFGHVGQHCNFSFCHQQDFLPFECDGCKKIFCTSHARAADHECSLPSDYDSIFVIICPICEARLKLKAKEDPNTLWDQHSTRGECKPKAGGGGQVTKKCMASKCYAKLTSINAVTCSKCCKEVCMKHRYEDKHDCTQIVSNQVTAKSKLVQNGYFKNQSEARKEPEQQPMMSSSEYKALEANINKFGVQKQAKEEKYTPERCEFCGDLFRDINELIKHAESHFEQPVKQKTETEKCPHCPKRFALTEIVNHLQQDHFIF